MREKKSVVENLARLYWPLKNKKLLALIVVVVVAVAAVYLVLRNLSKPSVRIGDKVDYIIVRYHNGGNLTVAPSSSEGEKIVSVTEEALCNLICGLGFLHEKGTSGSVQELKENLTYVELVLEKRCEFTVYFHGTWPPVREVQQENVTTDRILFFKGKVYVLFRAAPSSYDERYGYAWNEFQVNDDVLQKLWATVDEIKP